MKFIIIHGSYRKGNTNKVVECIKNYLCTFKEVEFEDVLLSQAGLEFCKGCNRCFMEGEEFCPHAKSIKPIADKIQEADGLIITAPVHSLQVPDILKCWVDHMSYNFHRPVYFGKKALVVSTTAGAGTNVTSTYIRDVLKHWGFGSVYKINITCRSLSYEPSEKDIDYINNMSLKFYNDVKTKKIHKPSIKRVFYYNTWRAMAVSGEKTNTADYKYWKSNNMLEGTYIKPELSGLLSKFLGNTVFKLMKKVMSK